MNDLRDEQMRLLNAVLDDEATPEQQQQARELAERDPAFARALNQMLTAEARLQELYRPSENQPVLPAAAPARFGWGRTLAYAALVALAGVVGFFAITVNDPDRANAGALHRGFVVNPAPTTVCDTPEKFLAYTREHLEESIAADFSPGVTLVGWRDAGPGYDERSRVRLLLAYAQDGAPVVVLFQPRRHRQPMISDGSLKLHHARFGRIEAWEISSADTPVVLPRLQLVRNQ